MREKLQAAPHLRSIEQVLSLETPSANRLNARPGFEVRKSLSTAGQYERLVRRSCSAQQIGLAFYLAPGQSTLRSLEPAHANADRDGAPSSPDPNGLSHAEADWIRQVERKSSLRNVPQWPPLRGHYRQSKR